MKKNKQKKEIKAYALIIPTEEMYSYWMRHEHASTVFNRIDLIAMSPTYNGAAWALLFRDIEDRADAYDAIKEVYPESLVAFEVRPAYVETKYLKDQGQES